MKKLILSVFALLVVSSQAFAFVPQVQILVNREVVVARVWNTNYRPIICSGQAFGRTYQGVVLNSWVTGLVIYPNVSADVYVHSNYYDPMIQGWAQINCQFGW